MKTWKELGFSRENLESHFGKWRPGFKEEGEEEEKIRIFQFHLFSSRRGTSVHHTANLKSIESPLELHYFISRRETFLFVANSRRVNFAQPNLKSIELSRYSISQR